MLIQTNCDLTKGSMNINRNSILEQNFLDFSELMQVNQSVNIGMA